MAIGQPQTYSQWMAQNPQLVQQVQQRYSQQPAPVAAQPPPPPVQQQQPVAPVAQAMDTERAPVAGGATVKSVPMTQSGSGAVGGVATEQKDKGNEGAVNLAKTIASFWTGGAASGIMGAAGGSQDNRMQQTMEPGAEQKGSQGGIGLQDILGIVGSIKGMKGGK